MRACGGAAFSRDNSVERYFRDARAIAVMAPRRTYCSTSSAALSAECPCFRRRNPCVKPLLLVGAVAYAPKVVVIWDTIKDFFAAEGCPIDYVFYSNYELLQDALIAGHVHIAWNSPLAWLDAQRKTGGTCRAIAMRDTDRDRVSHLLVRKDSGIETVADLVGKTVATGAKDSPQATLIPLGMLDRAGRGGATIPAAGTPLPGPLRCPSPTDRIAPRFSPLGKGPLPALPRCVRVRHELDLVAAPAG
jgi:ABC-type phosphate/phosphonate transport system substrate-binding protein